MPLIVSIDTATEYASICLSQDGQMIAFEENDNPKNHGAFIQPAIKKMMAIAQKNIGIIDAIAVANGPGSYTGLRVGLASAKGLCYALNKPLITVNTLEVMALAVLKEETTGIFKTTTSDNELPLLCPMIDARRMEVFTGLYNSNLQAILSPSAMLLDETSFATRLDAESIIFSGSGSQKLQAIIQHKNAIFLPIQHSAYHLSLIAEIRFTQNDFSELAYSEPYYLKEFFTPQKTKV